MEPIDVLLDRLSKVKRTKKGWLACCPAHDDRHPSMNIKETPDGTVLVKCWVGCTADEIVSAVGLQLRDLFVKSHRPQRKPAVPGFSRAELTRILDEEKAILFVATCDMRKGKFKESDDDRVRLAERRVKEVSRRLAQ